MKMITLNIWGGFLSDRLIPFVERNADVDFFLFQEMYHQATEKTNWGGGGNLHIFEDIQVVLPKHDAYFASAQDGEFGLAGFIKKGSGLAETGDIFVHRHKDAMTEPLNAKLLGRNLQFFKFSGERPFSLLNFHGLWTGAGKEDTAERLEQSRRIVDFATTSGEFVLTGDFNLLPHTESIRILESMQVRNLISEYGITNTRTSHYTKPEKFADYTFVTPGITVHDFRIMPDEVSDHAAMYLEFDVV